MTEITNNTRIAQFASREHGTVSIIQTVDLNGRVCWEIAIQANTPDSLWVEDDTRWYDFDAACERVWSLVGYNASSEGRLLGKATTTSLVMATNDGKVWAANGLWSSNNRRPAFHSDFMDSYPQFEIFIDGGERYKTLF